MKNYIFAPEIWCDSNAVQEDFIEKQTIIANTIDEALIEFSNIVLSQGIIISERDLNRKHEIYDEETDLPAGYLVMGRYGNEQIEIVIKINEIIKGGK